MDDDWWGGGHPKADWGSALASGAPRGEDALAAPGGLTYADLEALDESRSLSERLALALGIGAGPPAELRPREAPAAAVDTAALARSGGAADGEADEAAERLPRDLALLALAYALPDRLDAFWQACRAGELPLARALADALELTAEDAHARNGWALYEACAGGHLGLAQWLDGRFGRAPWGAQERALALSDACAQGHLAVARWLVACFGAPAKDDGSREGWPLLLGACAGGHLETAQWLAATYNLEWGDEWWDLAGLEALSKACACGHLAIAQWLSMHAAGDWVPPRGLLYAACTGGRLDVAKWLVARFGFEAESARRALSAACALDELPLVVWLTQQLGVGDGEAHRGHTRCGPLVAQWMASRRRWGGPGAPPMVVTPATAKPCAGPLDGPPAV